MERDCKRKRSEKMKDSCEKRSPLQNLNGLPFHKRQTRKISNLSAVSGENPKVCFRSLSSSSSSSSSLCSRINLAKNSSKIAKSEPNKSAADALKVLRSKENEISRKPNLQKPEKKQPQCLSRRECGRSNRNPIHINGRRSKLSSVKSNPEHKLKKGSQEFQAKTKNSRENGSGKQASELVEVSNSGNLNSAENFRSRCIVIEDQVYEGDNVSGGGASKTPPVEASLSPEILCQSHTKMQVLRSGATPICYGAGHLLSGVTDKRKSRRRGSLKGDPYKVNLFDDERIDENVIDSLKEPLVPSLVEASVRWHLSPCNEGREDRGVDCRIVCDDDALVRLDLCGNESDSLCAESSYCGSDGVGNQGGNKNVIMKPLDYSMIESLLVTSPSDNLIGSDSKLSTGSLSSGNIIQTPDSDSDVCVGRSRLEVDHRSFVWPELDSINETLQRVNLSPRNEMPTWDTLGIPPPMSTQLQKNEDSVSSWVSDTALSNLSLSQMRISWRDGSGGRVVETDEFDCYCILSDDEINVDEDKETYQGDKSCQKTCLGVETSEDKENDLTIGNDLSPVLLDYEPCISKRVKEKSLSHRTDEFAESISTDAGGLVASDDSDWTYFHENHLFHVK